MFGYLLNEIGYTVNILRRSRQVVEKDLVTLDKMRHYYKIDNELMEKGRTYLINQSDRADHLSPEEENALMMKFNEDLRNSTTLSTQKSTWKTHSQSSRAPSSSSAGGPSPCRLPSPPVSSTSYSPPKKSSTSPQARRDCTSSAWAKSRCSPKRREAGSR